MEFLQNIALGSSVVFTFKGISAIIAGVVAGTIGGAIPGINATMTMAILLPFTWGMDPTVAILMYVGIYCGGQYGGSIPSVLIGTPGTPSSAATVMDGYPLHLQGKTGLALGMSLYASVFGGIVSSVALMIFAIPLAKVALAFGPPEYFALSLLGLTLVASLSTDVFKGLIAAALGLLLATIGLDPFAGIVRFGFGSENLIEGFEIIPFYMGIFALSQVLYIIFKKIKRAVVEYRITSKYPSNLDFIRCLPSMLIGSVIGMFVGAMPGAGASIACWLGYNEAKRWSRHPEEFGKGSLEGVAAPEATNNAVTGGAMVPLLSLGIPGSGSTAIMLGVLIIHGLRPGPMLFVTNPEIPYSIFVSLFVSNIFMIFVALLLIKLLIKVVNIPETIMNACILAIIFVGAYSVNNSMFDIFTVLLFGILGLVMKIYDYPITATALGFVLGYLVETNFRRSLTLSKGDWSIFLTNPISMVIITLSVLSVAYAVYCNHFRKKRGAAE
ncbi:tripartite tricarboxylate transporter permease [Aminivibrio sp.]|jgi:putative tricarboxylic transport membrane protein|uniref:tripartite tricarboxylate transporter permease n=1 Tax=Aminivibrio sp. TaxID=1872489 RepID=UPI001A3CF78B|nr:tripartite tricarboxylate transporter permease [Aminivibrio sp.]MBL3539694.1 tripartite tricarboxylate transporter permease [Aminivibrio sp.]MDK2958999.1 putative tricarboxylic transport rane protein [Synergistaceae bacterium]